jgi:hypothetical protein
VKNVGEPCAGKSHARFDVGGGRKPGQSASPRGPGASRRPYRDRGAHEPPAAYICRVCAERCGEPVELTVAEPEHHHRRRSRSPYAARSTDRAVLKSASNHADEI